MALSGVDVSRHQGPINWQQVRDVGYDFAFCKATDGTSYPYTGYFHTQFPQIKSVGLTPGAYHWLQPGNGAAQARYFVQTVGSFDGVLAAVDVEDDNNGTANPHATLFDFASEFARLTGNHPLIVYTGQWFWVGHMGNPQGAHLGPLWHSEYETSQAEIDDGPELDNYGGWPAATFWQYTSSGLVPGISTRCDVNLFFGGAAELAALAGGSTPIQEDDMAYPVIVSEAPRDAYLALFPGHVEVLNDWEEYQENVNAGFLQPVRGVGPRTYDVAADFARRTGVAPNSVNEVLAELTTNSGGRLGAIWGKLEEILAATGDPVDENAIATAVAQHVLATLTPEVIVSAIPASLAKTVVELLAAKLAA